MSFIECKPLDAKSQLEPVALSVLKRGRWCIVGKLTTLNSEIVLGIAIKEQQGTSEIISLPPAAVEYAEQHGARWLYWRKDRHPLEMRRVELQAFRQKGFLQHDGEVYFPLAKMEPVPWRQWEYAERVIHLGDHAEGKPGMNVPKQLSLALEGA
jgi:hypothetical protein